MGRVPPSMYIPTCLRYAVVQQSTHTVPGHVTLKDDYAQTLLAKSIAAPASCQELTRN